MRAQRVGPARLRGLDLHLSPRDWRVLRFLDEHQFLTTSHITRLLFADHASPLAGVRACVRVLDRLRRLGLLDRLTRRIGGVDAGSRGYVWYLTAIGDRLLRHIDGEDAPPRRRAFEPSVTFLEHSLAVAEVRVELEEAARAGHLTLDVVQTEPTAWRRYTDEYGRPAVLKPDLYAVTAAGDYEDHWFIEVDRGTESFRTLSSKSAAYEAYRRTGREQDAAGVFPLVVWLVEDGRRRDRLTDEIRRSRDLDPAVFRVVAPKRFIALVTGTSPPADGTTTPIDTQLAKGGTP